MRVFKSLTLGVFVLLFCVSTVASAQADGVDKLINQLKDENWSVRIAAAKALVKIGDSRAVKPLIAVLKDKNEIFARQTAAEALKKITGQDFGEDYEKWSTWWQEQKK